MLSFTLAYRIFEPPPNPDQLPPVQYADQLVIGILEAILAWALIDAVMKVLLAVFERSEKHRLLNSVQSAGTQDAEIEAVAEELDEILEPITAEENRRSLYQDVVEHLRGSRPQPVRVTLEDVTHALAVFFAAVFAVLPRWCRSFYCAIILSWEFVFPTLCHLLCFSMQAINGESTPMLEPGKPAS